MQVATLFRRPAATVRPRRSGRTLPVELLEDRILLSSVSVAAEAPQTQAVLDGALATITDVVVESVEVVDGVLIANARIVGTVLDAAFDEVVAIPLTLVTGEPQGECPVLDLALGPVHLDVLGVNVDLDDCSGGPVTATIVADPEGGVLGDLLCTVANLLDGGGELADLTADQLQGLTDVLNAVLGNLLSSGDEMALQSHGQGNGSHGNGQGGGKTCEILSLEIENGLQLDLLGLEIETSPICLDVTAERGSGNLVGNLLCSVTHLLDSPGNPLDAVFAQLNRIQRELNRL